MGRMRTSSAKEGERQERVNNDLMKIRPAEVMTDDTLQGGKPF